ncbi:probable serine/threonine-protein kinase nek1 [Chenopodium quinoa]|uniref:probable serine/threonine-protein kinase nek1 n=1 Tax=Chenopodium quinoa TaxID=63459 RepID=UPI000B772723|nr:probable serine/threonine-protein kinase nek1 [Chenopodium quinoa]
MAKKLATLKPPLFMGKEDPMLVENWVRDFDKIFNAAGTPDAQKRQKYNEFSRFNQTAGMSVQEYAEKFNEYARFCPNVVPDERSKAQKFEDGLTFRIQKKVIGAGTAATYKEAYDRACNIERILKREQEVKDRRKRKGNGESSSNHQGYDKRPRLGGNNNGNGGNGQQGGHNNNNRSNNHRGQG